MENIIPVPLEVVERSIYLKPDSVQGYSFILDGVIQGSFEFDFKNEKKNGYYRLSSSMLSSASSCKYGFVYKAINTGAKLKSLLKNKSWDDAVEILGQYLYLSIESKIGDPTYINRINRDVRRLIQDFHIDSFKEVAVIVSCNDTLKEIGIRPKSGWFF